MTVFGGAFGYKWKLGSKRQAGPAPVDAKQQQQQQQQQQQPQLQLQQQQQKHSNSSNSSVETFNQQLKPPRQRFLADSIAQQKARAASVGREAAFLDATAPEVAQRPPRQQIRIPGDTDEKLSDDEKIEDEKQEEPTEQVECPTGKHKTKKDSVCSCILLAQFKDKLTVPVISEWHSVADVGGGGCGSAASPVSLRDFKLAKNKVFQGGQGVVYIVKPIQEAEDSREELVMKFKERRKKQRMKSWKRDLREVFMLKELKHPFIIDLKHAYLTNSFYCLVMDYGSRGSLWSLVCRHGCMPKPIAAYYVACILSAVRYVHKNSFIFRDLKAENVVVMPDLRPKLIDFGMAKSHNKPSVRNTSTSFYFAAYIAPEVYADPKGVTEKVDSWGIGYLTLELTVGLGVFKSLPWTQTKHTAPDWKFEMPKRYVSRLTRDACRFIEKSLDRRPEKRPSLDQLMDFQFLEEVDFRLLPTLKPKGIDAYLAKRSES